MVWLNEAQFYLDPAYGAAAGEKVAAGLWDLVRDPDRGPVLVLATLWPEYWGRLTARPMPAAADWHSSARALLADGDIPVPAALTVAEQEEAAAAGDPRLALAVQAPGGRVIQLLAGAPELIRRYHTAPPAAGALLDAAADARRVGMGPALSRAFLAEAAPGYIADADWDALPRDWIDEALAFTAAPAKGIRGTLAPARPPGPAVYQLADYLEQYLRRTRRGRVPPAEFWAASARHASLVELPGLARAAEACGLLRDAASLRKRSAGHGNTHEAVLLVRGLRTMRLGPPDDRPAQWAAAHASLDQAEGLGSLLIALQETGADQQAGLLAARAAANAPLIYPYVIAILLIVLRELRADGPIAVLIARDPAAHASLDDLRVTADLLCALRDTGAQDQVAALVARAIAHASFDDPYHTAYLLQVLHDSGVGTHFAAVADCAVAQASLEDPDSVARFLEVLQATGADQHLNAFIARNPAAHVALFRSSGIDRLLRAFRNAGADLQAYTLADRRLADSDSARVPGGDSTATALRLRRESQMRASQRLNEDWSHLFQGQVTDGHRYWFGRQVDGSPAPRWGWDDLD